MCQHAKKSASFQFAENSHPVISLIIKAQLKRLCTSEKSHGVGSTILHRQDLTFKYKLADKSGKSAARLKRRVHCDLYPK